MQKLSDSPVGADISSAGERLLATRTGGLESPSLFGSNTAETNAPAAYELKFLLTEELACAVAEYLRGRLSLDPHADPSLGGAYQTTSLYTDTPDFDVFHRVGEYATSKCRVRRYGVAGPVFLERKDKDGERVRKCRATVPADELTLLGKSKRHADWVGEWFCQQLAARKLAPVCRIAYERLAFMGLTDAGTVRVTFDRNIRGEAAAGWELAPVGAADELLPGLVVCEFKFRVALPTLLKEVVASHGLAPTRVSKYRRFVRASRLAGDRETSATGEDGSGDVVNG